MRACPSSRKGQLLNVARRELHSCTPSSQQCSHWKLSGTQFPHTSSVVRGTAIQENDRADADQSFPFLAYSQRGWSVRRSPRAEHAAVVMSERTILVSGPRRSDWRHSIGWHQAQRKLSPRLAGGQSVELSSTAARESYLPARARRRASLKEAVPLRILLNALTPAFPRPNLCAGLPSLGALMLASAWGG